MPRAAVSSAYVDPQTGELTAPPALGGAVLPGPPDPNEGLNDPSPRPPVGDNPGTTLGAQRFYAVQHAADVWAELLESDVEVFIEAHFDPLDSESCAARAALLGFGSPLTAFSDFAGAPRPATLYASALAGSLARIALNPGEADLALTLNGQIDRGCFTLGAPNGWYYGLDGISGPGRIGIIPALLHEIAHGLGFVTFINLVNSRRCCGLQPQDQFDDAFMVHREDHDTGVMWSEMDDLQRAVSAVNSGKLHWVGNNVGAASATPPFGRGVAQSVESGGALPRAGNGGCECAARRHPGLRPRRCPVARRRRFTRVRRDRYLPASRDPRAIAPSGR